MSHVLWVEDFENEIPATVDQVFGLPDCPGCIPDAKKWLLDKGIVLETTFMDALRFVRVPARLRTIDYVVIDVDLKPYEDTDLDDTDKESEIFHFLKNRAYFSGLLPDTEPTDAQWKEAVYQLKRVAGYHIYTELLINAGFPKSHILFCSNHADHLTSITEAFRGAKLDPPEIFRKNQSEVSAWTREVRNNPYGVLRRGILSACKEVADILESRGAEAVSFGLFHKTTGNNSNSGQVVSLGYLRNYLANLESQLPLCEPVEQGEKRGLYRAFVQSLSREWDSRAEVRNLPNNGSRGETLPTFGAIMKLVRNWSAHGAVMGSLDEDDVAFIFMINLRSMFFFPEKAQRYEKDLFCLFRRSDRLESSLMLKKIGETASDRTIPLASAYEKAWRLSRDSRLDPEIHFDKIVANVHRALEGKELSSDQAAWFVQTLYQVFWLRPSNVTVDSRVSDTGAKAQFFISFRYFRFAKNDTESFLFHLARHIYGKSFST